MASLTLELSIVGVEIPMRLPFGSVYAVSGAVHWKSIQLEERTVLAGNMIERTLQVKDKFGNPIPPKHLLAGLQVECMYMM